MRPQRRPFQAAEKHAFRLELQLDFDRTTGATDARQVARRVVEALRLSEVKVPDTDHLAECRLVCHDLRSVLSLTLVRDPAPDR